MDLKEIGWWGAWTDFIWRGVGTSGGALVNAVMNLCVPLNARYFLTS